MIQDGTEETLVAGEAMKERVAGKRQDKLHYTWRNSLPHYLERSSASANCSLKYLLFSPWIFLKYGAAVQKLANVMIGVSSYSCQVNAQAIR